MSAPSASSGGRVGRVGGASGASGASRHARALVPGLTRASCRRVVVLGCAASGAGRARSFGPRARDGAQGESTRLVVADERLGTMLSASKRVRHARERGTESRSVAAAARSAARAAARGRRALAPPSRRRPARVASSVGPRRAARGPRDRRRLGLGARGVLATSHAARGALPVVGWRLSDIGGTCGGARDGSARDRLGRRPAGARVTARRAGVFATGERARASVARRGASVCVATSSARRTWRCLACGRARPPAAAHGDRQCAGALRPRGTAAPASAAGGVGARRGWWRGCGGVPTPRLSRAWRARAAARAGRQPGFALGERAASRRVRRAATRRAPRP
jgi:hypothetical protein